MRKKPIICLVLAGFLSSGCHLFDKKQQAGAMVEVHGQYLYRSTLDSLTAGMNADDSMRVAQQYISQWAKDVLIYDAVNHNQTSISPEELERMVEEYRRTVYALAYEEWLVENKMSRTVQDTTVVQLYAEMADRFKLEESVVKGALVVLPNDAPNQDKLRGWLTDIRISDSDELNSEALDEIEKYAYLSNGYELFLDRWLTVSDLMSKMPVEREVLETQLKTKNQIEVSDSLQTYIVQITDKQLRGTPTPIEYARGEIERIILNERKGEFLQAERARIYEEAVQKGEVKFY